jgi:predicted Zn-dependent peptidase
MTTFDAPPTPGAARDTGLAALSGIIGTTWVDGMPTLYAPREGLMTGGIFFRVGRADETLATSGITHLVEHLALYGQNLSGAHHNGETADAYTLFHVTGTEAEVVTHLNAVCAALRELPLARLETEKQILRTEASRREHGGFDWMRLWRYGPQGFGLAAYDELGTWRLTPDDVQSWVRTYFTRDNAVVFFTSDHVPAGLDLRLPPGYRQPVPDLPGTLPVTPAYFSGAQGGVVLDAVVGRSAAASMFTRVARRALFRDLRQEGGLSYAAEADYSPRDSERAVVTLYADALPEKQDAVVGGFVDTLARLRTGKFDPSDVEAARADGLKNLEVPELGAAMLPATALDLLMGARVKSPVELRTEIATVTVEDLRQVAHAVWSGALMQVPGRDVDWAGLTPAPRFSDEAVAGRAFPRIGHEGVGLVLGDDGVSFTTSQGPSTVRFGDCEALMTRPDGGRELIGRDGFRVVVEPTLYAGLSAALVAELVDTRVPADRVVPLPARDPDDIPQPPPAPGRTTGWLAGLRGFVRRNAKPLRWYLVGLAVFVVLRVWIAAT